MTALQHLSPHITFPADPEWQIPRNVSNQSFLSGDSVPVHLQMVAAFQSEHTCCLSLDFAFWSDGPLTKEGKKAEAEEEGEAREKILIEFSLPDNEFPPHHSNVSAECLSDSLQQILKCDNGPQKWVMLSFCWFHFPDPPYPCGLCTSIN